MIESSYPRQRSPWQLPAADVQWSEHGEPFSTAFGDIYFSRGDGLAETEYVFLGQNHLEHRWRALDPQRGGVFTIGETGFGTGLNFLAAWRLWREIAPPSWRLHYVSVEKFPLDRKTLEHALQQWHAHRDRPQLGELCEILLAHYPPRIRDFHLRHLDDSVTLQLLFGDATEQLNLLHDSAAPALANAFHIDAWFLDGFAPAKNPEMWQPALFEQIGRLSKPGTTFATFTVAGIVKRGMQHAGFNIEKFAGFGSKRQMLRGEFLQQVNFEDSTKPRAVEYWAFPPPSSQPHRPRVAVIGGGLAGATTANALAKRGCEVILLEQENSLANTASGNPQGVLYTKLSAQDGILNRFALASYLFALDFYRPLISQNKAFGDCCGVLQLLNDSAQWQQLHEAFSEQAEWLECVDPQRASALAHCTIAKNALWFSRAGWLAPKTICEYLASHTAIDVRTQCSVRALHRCETSWRLDTSCGEFVADAVVIANAHGAAQFECTAALPLKAIRGQITELPANYLREHPGSVICHDGYLTPNAKGLHIGATFDLHANDTADTALRPESHRHNLRTLHTALPALLRAAPENIDESTLNGRVGYRCTTPDYLPLVGAVADASGMKSRYAILARNANARIDEPGAYLPGLYVNVGHGSRGLTSTPLCAELIAASITNAVRPLPRDLCQALSPARFLLRDLIRGR